MKALWHPFAPGIFLLALLSFLAPATRAQQDVDEANPTPMTTGVPTRSTVYSVHDPEAIRYYVANTARVHAMVDRLVTAVTGKESVAAAWGSLVSPKDVVGIKISATGGLQGSTHRALVATIVEGLESAGVPRANILVWDREEDDLREAGYLPPKDQPGREMFPCKVSGIEPKYGYDPKAVYSSAVLGRLIWGDLDFQGLPVPADDALSRPIEDPLASRPSKSKALAAPTPQVRGIINPNMRLMPSQASDNLSNISHFCTILSRRVTKVINVPILSDNAFTGIGGALYNVTIPNVDNWRRLVTPPQYGTTAIPELYSDPLISGKVVLNITDGLIAQLAGGPTFQPFYARHHATLYASKDPVALDAVLLRYLEIWRAQAQLPAIKAAAAHVHTAADIGLGNYDADKIDLRRL